MKVTTDACLFGAWVAHTLQNNSSVSHILDIGSGTGILSLMVAQKTKAFIEAIELQHTDYRQSLQNLAASPWKDRIQIHHADALRFTYSKKYDAIICNPPFYENDLLSTNKEKNIAHHHQGLRLENLFSRVQKILHPQGLFFLLIPERRGVETSQLLQAAGFFINERISIKQTEKHGSFRQILKASFSKSIEKQSVIIIKNEQRYSEEFKNLLEDYYL